MRRVPALLLLLALALVAVPGVAFADDAPTTVLAQEDMEEEGEEADEGPGGPDPMPREQEENPARTLSGYEDQETPFTWGAAWILTFAGVVGLLLMGGLYQLLVRGPRQRSE